MAARSFSQAIEFAAAVRDATAVLAVDRGWSSAVLVADEGGLGIGLPTNRAALELLVDGITAAGLRPGADAAEPTPSATSKAR